MGALLRSQTVQRCVGVPFVSLAECGTAASQFAEGTVCAERDFAGWGVSS